MTEEQILAAIKLLRSYKRKSKNKLRKRRDKAKALAKKKYAIERAQREAQVPNMCKRSSESTDSYDAKATWIRSNDQEIKRKRDLELLKEWRQQLSENCSER